MTLPEARQDGMYGSPPRAVLVGQFYAERNREYPLKLPLVSVGRSRANTLRIPDERVSPHHVRIAHENSGYTLEVLTADAPTTLNGSPMEIGEQRRLRDGDVIGLSDLEFRFLVGGTDALSRLWVLAGVHRGKLFRIDRSHVMIGRAFDNDIQFPDRSVSRRHCRVFHRDGAWWIEDLDSTNGTLVNGRPIRGEVRLNNKDEVDTGYSRFVFQQRSRVSGNGGENARPWS